LVQVKVKKAAIACTWNHTSTAHVSQLNLEYREGFDMVTALLT
jgi:hypothetical protein